MASKNKNLNAAAKAKKDEFYTQLVDIENELRHYENHFAGKTVFCNCDDPFESQFFFYFVMKFNFLRLKKIIVTSYTGSPVVGNLFCPVEDAKPAYKVVITRIDREPLDWQGVNELMNELKAALGQNVNGNILSLLAGDGQYLAGDFRSKECVELLKQADIVVTNPPFSLFREYVAQLMAFDKKFLIIGNKNAITYKEIFPLIKENKLWAGVRPWTGGMWFVSTDENNFDKVVDGKNLKNAAAIWLTNLEHEKRNRPYDLVFSYKENPERYPRYDNYDAIEVSKTGDIPDDFFGVMGVPITFLDKYCPDQFEIIGCTYLYGDPGCHADGTSWGAKIDVKDVYKRLFIRRKKLWRYYLGRC